MISILIIPLLVVAVNALAISDIPQDADFATKYEIHLFNGVTLQHSGKVREALDSFTSAEEYATNKRQLAVISQYRGSCYNLLDEVILSLQEYDRSLKLNRYDSITYMGKVSTLLNTPQCKLYTKTAEASSVKKIDGLSTTGECVVNLQKFLKEVLEVVYETTPDEMLPIIYSQYYNGSTTKVTRVMKEQVAIDGNIQQSNQDSESFIYSSATGYIDKQAPYHYTIFQIADVLQYKELAWQSLLLAHHYDVQMLKQHKELDLEQSQAILKLEHIKKQYQQGFWPPSEYGFGSNSTVPIFIVGFPRSGSTLLEAMLASHRDIATIGEHSIFSKHVHELLQQFDQIVGEDEKEDSTVDLKSSEYDETATEITQLLKEKITRPEAEADDEQLLRSVRKVKQYMKPYIAAGNERAEIIVQEMMRIVKQRNDDETPTQVGNSTNSTNKSESTTSEPKSTDSTLPSASKSIKPSTKKSNKLSSSSSGNSKTSQTNRNQERSVKGKLKIMTSFGGVPNTVDDEEEEEDSQEEDTMSSSTTSTDMNNPQHQAAYEEALEEYAIYAKKKFGIDIAPRAQKQPVDKEVKGRMSGKQPKSSIDKEGRASAGSSSHSSNSAIKAHTKPTAKKQNPKHIIDKMLGNYHDIGMIHLLFPNAVILHIYRDPLDVLWSCFQRKFTSVHMSYTVHPITLVKRYMVYLQIMVHYRQQLPGRVVDVSYESLVSHPEAVLWHIITNQLHLSWDSNVLSHHLTRQQEISYTASMFQVRQPTYNSSVGSWKKYGDYLLNRSSTYQLNVTATCRPSENGKQESVDNDTEDEGEKENNPQNEEEESDSVSETEGGEVPDCGPIESVDPLLHVNHSIKTVFQSMLTDVVNSYVANHSADTESASKPLSKHQQQDLKAGYIRTLLPLTDEYNWKMSKQYNYNKLLLKERLRLAGIWNIDLLRTSKGNYPPPVVPAAGSANDRLSRERLLQDMDMLLRIELQENLSLLYDTLGLNTTSLNNSILHNVVIQKKSFQYIRILETSEGGAPADNSETVVISPISTAVLRIAVATSPALASIESLTLTSTQLQSKSVSRSNAEYLFSLLLVYGRHLLVYHEPLLALKAYEIANIVYAKLLMMSTYPATSVSEWNTLQSMNIGDIQPSDYQLQSLIHYHIADAMMLIGLTESALVYYRNSIHLDLLHAQIVATFTARRGSNNQVKPVQPFLTAYRSMISVMKDIEPTTLAGMLCRNRILHLPPVEDPELTQFGTWSSLCQEGDSQVPGIDIAMIAWTELIREMTAVGKKFITSGGRDAPLPRSRPIDAADSSDSFGFPYSSIMVPSLQQSLLSVLQIQSDLQANEGNMDRNKGNSRHGPSSTSSSTDNLPQLFTQHYVHNSLYWGLFYAYDSLNKLIGKVAGTNKIDSVSAPGVLYVQSRLSMPSITKGNSKKSTRKPSATAPSANKEAKEENNNLSSAVYQLQKSLRWQGWNHLQRGHATDLHRILYLSPLFRQSYSGAVASTSGIDDTLPYGRISSQDLQQILQYHEVETDNIWEHIRTTFKKTGFYPSTTRYGTIGSTSRIPIFIVGSYRSGSTLLENLLTSYPGILGISENSAFMSELMRNSGEFDVLNIRNSSDVLANKSKIKQIADNIVQEMLTEGDRMSANAVEAKCVHNRYSHNDSQKLDTDCSTMKSSNPEADSQKRRLVKHVVDKSLNNYRNIGYIHLLFPKAIILHIYRRNVMDTLWSCYQQRFDSVQLSYTLHPESLVREYVLYSQVVHYFKQMLPKNNIIDVEYEQLVSDPVRLLKEIIVNKLRLPWDNSVLGDYKAAGSGGNKTNNMAADNKPYSLAYTASLMQIRRPIHNNSIGQWKQYTDTNMLKDSIELEMNRYIPMLKQLGVKPFADYDKEGSDVSVDKNEPNREGVQSPYIVNSDDDDDDE